MSQSEPEIEILEYRGEKRIAFNGIGNIDLEGTSISEISDTYGDTIIELHNITERYNTRVTTEHVHLAWHSGRVVADVSDQSKFQKLVKYSPVYIKKTSQLSRMEDFYEMYPNGDYNPEISWSAYQELLAASQHRSASRKAIGRLTDAEISPSVDDARSWMKVRTQFGGEYTFENILQSVASTKENRKRIYQSDSYEDVMQKFLDTMDVVYLMEGLGESVETDEDRALEVATQTHQRMY